MKVIGVTGGVGAGKTQVLSILEKEYHAFIIMADMVGADMQRPGQACYAPIIEEFGTDILSDEKTEDGYLIDRKKLADVVFSDHQRLVRLNQIVHPQVEAFIRNTVKTCREDLVVVESALLLGVELDDILDEIWYIYADRDTRIKRLMEGRGYTREKILSVMASQMSDQLFREGADHIIDNSASLTETKRQIDMLLNG